MRRILSALSLGFSSMLQWAAGGLWDPNGVEGDAGSHWDPNG